MKKQTHNQPPSQAREVLDFWFCELDPKQWWARDDAVDQDIISRFGALYQRLGKAVPRRWLETPRGVLAAVIVLDQFPRNMFRGSAKTFGTDASALAHSEAAIEAGLDNELTRDERSFLYMPLQHFEERGVQARSMELFGALGDVVQLEFAAKHKEIIDRFGRFPHRNEMLGRVSSKAEIEFLKAPGLFW